MNGNNITDNDTNTDTNTNHNNIRPVRLLRVWVSEGLTQANS